MRIKQLFIFVVVLALFSGMAMIPIVKPAAAAAGLPVSVSSDHNPSHIGDNVKFTATVTAPLAFGNMVFLDGATVLSAVNPFTPDGFLGSSGTSTVSFETSSLSSGTHSITAVAFVFPSPTPNISNPIVQTVQGALTTTTVTGAPSPPTVFGQGVTFTATVAANVSSVGTPTGSVQFTDNGASIGSSQQLTGGTTSVNSPNLPVGPHNIVANYTSDNSDFIDSSGDWSQQVVMASTTTGVVSNVSPSVFGQPVVLTATVGAVAPGAGTPTGTVTFSDGANNLGSPGVAGGQASLTVAGLSVGPHTLVASYNGDANFKTSSGSLSQTVNQAPTATSVTSSANPSVFGQPVSFTATVCPAPPSTQPTQAPSGTVAFTADGATTAFDTKNISAASAPPGCASTTSILIGSFSVATHSISVTYQSDPNFLTSTGTLTGGQVVNKAPTATALTSAPNPSYFGDGVTLTATVTVPPPGAGTPTGIVTFTDGGMVLATRPLDATGHATFVTAGLQVGAHSLAAAYSGDGNFLPSLSATGAHLVRCLTIVTGRVNGGLTVSGSTCVNNATVNGGITVLPGAALSLTNSTVNGGVSSSGAKAVTWCGNLIHGASIVSTTSGFVLIGDSGDDGFSCAGNDMRGNLTLTANAGQLELSSNHVSGGVTITNTTGTGPNLENLISEIEGNQISGQLSCTNNTPAPINDGHPNTVTGSRSGQCGAAGF
jgi:hypothetical protein